MLIEQMKQKFQQALLAITVLTMFTGCAALPKIGPSAGTINRSADNVSTVEEAQAASVLEQRAVIFDINDNVTNKLIHLNARNQFAQTWRDSLDETVIGAGDALQVSIWEAPPAVLFGGVANELGLSSGKAVELPVQMVDQQGRITVPFIGQVTARNKSIHQVEVEIASRLSRMANKPQVIVTPIKGGSASVMVFSDGASARLPLTPRGERILDAVSALGGVKSANKTTIQITRGPIVKSMALSEITRDPHQNILLRAGDVITASYEPYSFIILGAAGRNDEINFEGTGITLAQAFGRARGLDGSRANAAGIYVFRYEDPQTVEQMGVAVSNEQKQTKVPVVYQADFSDPNALFHAQNFAIRDKDVLYVAEAGSVPVQKFLSLVGSIIGPLTNFATGVNNAAAAADRLNN